MEIRNKAGEVIAVSDPPESRIFDGMTLHNADLAGLELEGISFDGCDLCGSDLTNADLYWATLSDVSFESCVLVGADLSGAFMYKASFRNADLRGAIFTRDNLNGRTCLNIVDFSGANLDGADFTDAVYDEETIFPAGFDPRLRGLTPKAEIPEPVRLSSRAAWEAAARLA